MLLEIKIYKNLAVSLNSIYLPHIKQNIINIARILTCLLLYLLNSLSYLILLSLSFLPFRFQVFYSQCRPQSYYVAEKELPAFYLASSGIRDLKHQAFHILAFFKIKQTKFVQPLLALGLHTQVMKCVCVSVCMCVCVCVNTIQYT